MISLLLMPGAKESCFKITALFNFSNFYSIEFDSDETRTELHQKAAMELFLTAVLKKLFFTCRS